MLKTTRHLKAAIVMTFILCGSAEVGLALTPEEEVASRAAELFKLAYFDTAGEAKAINAQYPIVKWRSPIKVGTNFDSTQQPELLSAIEEGVRWAKEAGYDISLLPAHRSKEANVLVIAADTFSALNKADADWISGVRGASPGVAKKVWNKFKSKLFCASDGRADSSYAPQVYYAFVHIETSADGAKACVSRIVFGALGFNGSKSISIVSIFNDNDMLLKLTKLDMIVLRMLNDPRFVRGMRYDEILDKLISAVARQMIGAHDAKLILQEIESTDISPP